MAKARSEDYNSIFLLKYQLLQLRREYSLACCVSSHFRVSAFRTILL